MRTKEIITESFKKDFKQLLKKYDAEFDVIVEQYELGTMARGIEVYIPHEFDLDGELIREATTIEFTKWFSHEEL